MTDVFFSTLPIFLITLLGNIIKNMWFSADDFWRGLEKLSYFILFPCMLFNYISQVDFVAHDIFKIIVLLMSSVVITAIFVIIYKIRNNIDGIVFTSIFQGSVRYSNYVFFALSSSLLGIKSLGICTVIAAYMIIFTNVLTIIIFAIYIPHNQKNNPMMFIKLVTTNPLIMSSAIGFIFNIYDIQINIGISKCISCLGDSALAIGMLVVGAELQLKSISTHLNYVVFANLIKLIFMPLVTIAIMLTVIPLSGIEKSIAILYSCVPCANTSYVLSRQLGGDIESMTSIITYSIIFSVISISIIMYIAGLT
ncbi:MAG: AEC family transporter [Rickettsiaceae bacterium]